MKRSCLVVVGIIGAIVILGAVAWFAWAPRHLAPMVASRLSAIYGGPVQVSAVQVGASGSSLRGLKLYEAGTGTADTPWASVAEADADVTVEGLATGHTSPQHLRLRGADVTLRFDREGHLLTHIPHSESHGAALPRIDIEQGRLTIRQEGRPEMVVSGIAVAIHPKGKTLSVGGKITDPRWGSWTVRGDVDPGSGAGSADLQTARTHVRQAMLNELPFIPGNTWQEVRLEGNTSCAFTLTMGTGPHDFRYRVTLNPVETRVTVPSIGLVAEHSTGNVVIEDNVVRLSKVTGQAADGEIRMPKAELDFRGERSKLAFQVEVDKLNVRKLPASWALPGKIEGKLTGKADLLLTIGGGRVQTSGTGHGVIQDARIAGLPAEPIRLDLHAAGRGFEFRAPGSSPGGRAALTGVPVILTALKVEQAAPPQTQSWPGWLVNQTVDALADAIGAVQDAGQAVLTRLTRPAEAPARTASAAQTLDVNLAMRDVDLDKLLKGLGVRLPFSVSGRLTFRVKASIPVNSTGDLRSYRLDGTASLSRVSLAGLEMEQVQARVDYREGVLNLQELTGRIPSGPPPGSPPGTFHGTARLQVAPQGDLTAQLTVTSLPLARVLALVPGMGQAAGGTVSGQMEARAPAAGLQDPAGWHATGSLRSDRLEAYGQVVTDARAELRLEGGVARVSSLKGQAGGLPVDGSGEVRLVDPYPFRATLTVAAGDLAELTQRMPQGRLPFPLAGQVEATVQAQGTLHPLTYRTSGTAHGKDLKLEQFRIDDVHFRWKNDPDKLTLSDVRGTLYQGTVTGEAVVPLTEHTAGRVDLGFKDVDVAGLSHAVPGMPVPLEGRAAGTVHGTLPPAGPGRERSFSARLDLKAPRLRVQGIPAEKLTGSVEYDHGAVDYKLQGETLGGTFDVNGRVPARQPAGEPARPPEPEGRLLVRGAQLGRLWRALAGPGGRPPVGGRVDVDVRYRHEPGGAPTGRGSVVFTRLRWEGTVLTDRLAAELDLGRGELWLRNASAFVAGGTLRGRGALRFGTGRPGWFNITLEGAELSQLLAPWPDVAARVRGPATITARGTVAGTVSGSGQVFFLRGRLGGAEVTEGRVPFSFDVSRDGGRFELRDATLQVANGRIVGRGEVEWGGETRVNARVDFTHVDLQVLLREVGGTSSAPAGRMTGRFTLDGGNIRSVNDLTGLLVANMGQTQAFQYPIFQQLIPYIIPWGSPSLTFDSGSLRARLGRGMFRVEHLGMEGRTVRLFAEGNVTLAGRLSLDVTATTGRLAPSPLVLQTLGLRVPIGGPVPIGLILEVSSFLSNRVVRLHVDGTLRSPSIQVEPLSILSQEAVLFFLYRAGVPIP